jgi:hypothetical protein
MNIGVTDPATLKTTNDGLIASVKYGSFVVGSLTGVTSYFADGPGRIRGICVKPFFHSWQRFAGVLGQVFSANKLYFPSWEGGVVFATSCCKSQGATAYPDKRYGVHAPIHGSNLATGSSSRSHHL